jgi:hypothetical protein
MLIAFACSSFISLPFLRMSGCRAMAYRKTVLLFLSRYLRKELQPLFINFDWRSYFWFQAGLSLFSGPRLIPRFFDIEKASILPAKLHARKRG